MERNVTVLDQSFHVLDTDLSTTAEVLEKDFAKHNPFTLLDNPKTVVDIGANIGMWSFYVAKKYPECQVYAIEPHPLNLIHLQTGVIRNGLSNVRVVPCAASNKPDLIRLWMSPSNTGACGIYNNHYQGTTPVIAPALPLNRIFEHIAEEYVDHVKVDIEGAEFTLFEGFQYWHRIKSLRVEVHPFPQWRDKQEADRNVEAFVQTVRDGMQERPFTLFGDYAELYT